ncbi:MAG: YceD family protein [Thiomicrorhabdus sp.]|nr:YceD family protein [Thiomicrorhabdus sp.]
MFNKLPDFIDPIYAVNHNKRFAGRVNQSRLKRLVEAVIDADREVDVQIEFFYDKVLRFPAFIMKVETSLNLQCQRSLESFDLPVATELKGVFTETLALTQDLPADVEVYELDGEKVSLFELVEEELLLSVPLAPIDDSRSAPEFEGASNQTNAENQQGDISDAAQKPNPFAKLQELKK